jgi:CDP-diacylglycerol---serine O-phosphatidyltransferase
MANIIVRNIPNSITCCNLISGCIATYNAFLGDIRMALLWIIVGAVFDFFDGMSARLLKVSSPIGKELDSLADDITFGFAPSAIIFYELSIMEYPSELLMLKPYLPYFAFVMAAYSALRLAKFNLDERQSLGFIGLPTPANALFWGALFVGAQNFMESTVYMLPVVLLMICVSCWLLIAEVPMFALKFKQWGWKGNEVKYIFLISCLPLLMIFGITAFSVIIAWYVVLSVVVNLRNKK